MTVPITLLPLLLALLPPSLAGPIFTTPTTAVPTTTPTSVSPSNPSVSPDLMNQLQLAPTSEDRFALLSQQGPADTWLKYDFTPDANPNPGGGKGLGGQGDLANRKTFPALINLGVAMSAGFMNPCGMNKPHIHPRASEFLTLVRGSNVHTGFILENGFTDQQSTTLGLYQGAILPQGSIHYEFNDNCEPAVFVAAFSNDDPGLSTIGKNFFNLDPDIVDADLGFPDVLDATNFADFEKAIPKSFALGAKSCLDRCGIKY